MGSPAFVDVDKLKPGMLQYDDGPGFIAPPKTEYVYEPRKGFLGWMLDGICGKKKLPVIVLTKEHMKNITRCFSRTAQCAAAGQVSADDITAATKLFFEYHKPNNKSK